MKRLHFMGIAGSGASGAAAIARGYGYAVSGCDRSLDSPYISALGSSIDCTAGHSPQHLRHVDMLVISPAILSLDPNNAEILAAQKQHIPVLTWPAFVGKELQREKFVIAIAGTHGKSTTTALIGRILEQAGLDPTVIVGATVPAWQASYRIGAGKYFVIEADEYDESFLSYRPDIAVITNVEFDHPEYFRDKEAYKKSFERFRTRVKPRGEVFTVSPEQKGEALLAFLQIPGTFNQQNALLAIRVAHRLGIADDVIRSVLTSFRGVARRFEIKGVTKSGAVVIDDYGHHPTEIRSTLAAARAQYPTKTIWLVYQPHMFSRTKALFHAFVEVFQKAPVEHIILVDIFPSREDDPGGISSQDIVKKVSKKTVQYIGGLEETAMYVARHAKKGDIVMNMGAGDIYKVSEMLLKNPKS